MKIAKNLDEFTVKSINATIEAMNSEEGQQLVAELWLKSLEKNPNLTEDEWLKIKQDFLAFMYFNLIKDNKDLMKELGEHLYTELNKNEN